MIIKFNLYSILFETESIYFLNFIFNLLLQSLIFSILFWHSKINEPVLRENNTVCNDVFSNHLFIKSLLRFDNSSIIFMCSNFKIEGCW